VIKIRKEKLKELGLWCCRCWAASVILNTLQLWEELKLVQEKEYKIKNKVQESELVDIKKEKKRIALAAVINFSYLPMCVHYSLVKSPFPDLAITTCGFLACLGELYKAWKAIPVL